MRIVFRSEERYRGQPDTPVAISAPAVPASEEERTPPAAPAQVFAMPERLEADGTLGVTLLGDLDLTVAEKLSARLEELKAAGAPVRLDLSQLGFIDSSGIQALLVALTDARWTGWQLDVAPEVSPSVARAAQIVGIAQVLWPEVRPQSEPDAAHAATARSLAEPGIIQRPSNPGPVGRAE
jgi:stage II sporulation protein AA (anti-sigma F factor antagonist)